MKKAARYFALVVTLYQPPWKFGKPKGETVEASKHPKNVGVSLQKLDAQPSFLSVSQRPRGKTFRGLNMLFPVRGGRPLKMSVQTFQLFKAKSFM